MTTDEIEKLADWGNAREVSTKNGPRLLRKAQPTEPFSELWKGGKKEELKAAGATFGKSQNGDWELCWWQPVTSTGQVAKQAVTTLTAEQEARLQAIESKLLVYQVPSVRQQVLALQNGGGLDASDTGTGKTFVTLAVSIVLDRPVYVICPKAVIPSWKRAARHFGIKLFGICNYELLRRGNEPAVKIVGEGKAKHFEWQLDPSTILVFDECHRCFPYDTVVVTDRGSLPIGEIVEQRLSVRVLSRNLSSDAIEYSNVTGYLAFPSEQICRVIHEHGAFTCTPDHRLWCEDCGQWYEARESRGHRLFAVRCGIDEAVQPESTSILLRPEVFGNLAMSATAVSRSYAQSSAITRAKGQGISGNDTLPTQPGFQATASCTETDEQRQSEQASRRSSEDSGEFQGPTYLSESRRERPANATATNSKLRKWACR